MQEAKSIEEQMSQVVNASITNDIVEEHRETLVRLLSNFRCFFASELLGSIPAEVESLSVQLVEGAKLDHGTFRTCAPLMVQMMTEHVNKLLSVGFIYENTNSR